MNAALTRVAVWYSRGTLRVRGFVFFPLIFSVSAGLSPLAWQPAPAPSRQQRHFTPSSFLVSGCHRGRVGRQRTACPSAPKGWAPVTAQPGGDRQQCQEPCSPHPPVANTTPVDQVVAETGRGVWAAVTSSPQEQTAGELEASHRPYLGCGLPLLNFATPL